RTRPGLRAGSGHLGRQRRGYGCADRAAQPRRARGDRGGRPPGREGRDRRRAALPGALRSRNGDPARDGSLSSPGGPNPTPHTPVGRTKRAFRTRAPAAGEEACLTEAGGRRGGGRAARQAARLHAVVERVPFLTRTMTPLEALSEEGLELIEHNADTILEQVGIEFRDAPEARALLLEGGAEVDGERVRFPRGLCRRLVQATAPPTFRQLARNPATTVEIGGRHP